MLGLREFNEAVSYNYSPGFIPFGLDDFALSVSMPAKSLADTIPARALMAWDRTSPPNPRTRPRAKPQWQSKYASVRARIGK